MLDLTPLPASLFEGGMGSFRPNIPLTAAFLRKSHRTIPPESLNVTEHYNYTAPLAVPDDHLTCIDNCYWFTENTQRFELLDEWRRGLGTWAAVGKHMYWRTEVEQLAVSVGKRLLGVRETQELPPVCHCHVLKLMSSTLGYTFDEGVSPFWQQQPNKADAQISPIWKHGSSQRRDITVIWRTRS